ncbi:LysR family transcriptional regulator [Marinobacter sp. X15-166B]|uniref:LysR family transcriptional regulator n=1 Tax=Marinobacter sp. X15-166B TaxID=1897620 RepID=UPI00085BF8B7|nr:LysR family transcriptional regulator [Marinobacter sp. X15-166B]OEY66124.1 LysR family transcriptional regulator [Marinobacter sp. X15-166B]
MEAQTRHRLWTHLHWLTVLAEQGTYTAAASRLGVSKASMSQHITELERLAGLPLVQRTTRSVRLTEAGQQLVDGIKMPFDQIFSHFARVSDLADEPSGKLRVTAPVAFARQQLLTPIADFLATYPGVRIELDLSDRLSSLAMEGFDLAIRHTHAPPDTHVAWLLSHTRSVLVASPSYLERSAPLTHPNELSRHACLHYPRPGGDTVWHFVQTNQDAGSRADPLTVPVSGPFSANNSEALRDAAGAGLGLAVIPDFSAQRALATGALTEVLPEWKPVESFAEQLYAIRPYAAHVPRAVGLLVQFLRTRFASGFSHAPAERAAESVT